MDLQKIPVLSSREMQRIEKLAVEQGADNAAFMEEAGRNIALQIDAVKKQLFAASASRKIALLAGKGNNAGDGFVALRHLKEKNYQVRAFLLKEEKQMSELCRKNYQAFLKAGGKAVPLKDAGRLCLEEDEIILDGIFGSGLQGAMAEDILKVIKKINSLKNFKISIDLPSGLDGNTGKVLPEAVKAQLTFYLGAAKRGFFLEKGPEYTGRLERIDFGLQPEFADGAEADFYLLTEAFAKGQLPHISRSQHKYEAGYVLGLAGSPSMEGAANLASRAALRAGAGIVRVFLAGKKADYKKLSDEIIKEHLDPENLKPVFQVCDKASSVFIGPGLGRDSGVDKILQQVLPCLKKPAVLDADCLYFLARHPDLQLAEGMVLTPHRAEMLRLLQEDKKNLEDEVLLQKCREFARRKGCILILKGAVSFIFYKNEQPLIVARGDPGMATAGSGDVLTGIAAAILAKKTDAFQAAALAVMIHALAGEKAAEKKSSYSLLASDLIEELAEVFKDLSF